MDFLFKFFLLPVFLGVIAFSPLAAQTRARVGKVCPLDGTEFQSYLIISDRPEGIQLDLKKTGKTIQPVPMAQCPACSFPFYKPSERYSDEEVTRLRATLRTERFQNEAKGRTPYYAMGVLYELLGEPDDKTAWAYLYASWENEAAPLYNEAAKRSLKFFDAAARNAERERRDKDAAYHVMLYLPVELLRRTGQFDEAQKRLETVKEKLSGTADENIRPLLDHQQTLIAQKNPTPQTPESFAPKPRAAPQKTRARTPAETEEKETAAPPGTPRP